MSQEERTDKNQVFARQPGIETRTAVEAVKAEFGVDIPVETIPIPSLGKLYDAEHPLHDVATLDISPMTAREEDILTSAALIKKGTVVEELIKSCMVDKRIDLNTMLSGDRNAVMIAIRVTGYGSDYEAVVGCGACGESTNRKFNLAELEIKRLTIEPLLPFNNLFEYVLPMTKKVVKFRFLTVGDENEISATQQRNKKMLNIVKGSLVTTNLLHSIVSIDDVNERASIARFVSLMPARDSKGLRDFMRKHEPGIVMRQMSRCDACGEEESVSIPMGTNFLWPASE